MHHRQQKHSKTWPFGVLLISTCDTRQDYDAVAGRRSTHKHAYVRASPLVLAAATDLLRDLVNRRPVNDGVWKNYQDFEKRIWWTDGAGCFYEGDLAWELYKDLEGNRWWCRSDSWSVNITLYLTVRVRVA